MPRRLALRGTGILRILPVRVSEAPGVAFSMARNGVLMADVDSDARSPAARIDWKLENTMYPYTITSAQLTTPWLVLGLIWSPVQP